MKRMKWLLLIMIPAWSFTVPISCNNKKKASTTQENKDTDAPVVISPDAQLRTSVNQVLASYNGVQADINDGVVTLNGSIRRDDLQNLMMKLQELKPKKIENKLVITTN
jgi:hypothetical protein